MVWDETQSGVNDSVFAPRFFMPSPGTLCRRIPNGAFMGDFDVGEMFHNFNMHPADQQYHGVSLPSELWKEAGAKLGRWTRLTMGFKPSLYLSCRMMARAIEIAKGPPDEKGSPFAFVTVKLNLPGMPTYDPTQPRVQKLNADGRPAGDVVVYMDDGRLIGCDLEQAEAAIRRICATLQALGIQDAARKRRRICQRSGA